MAVSTSTHKTARLHKDTVVKPHRRYHCDIRDILEGVRTLQYENTKSKYPSPCDVIRMTAKSAEGDLKILLSLEVGLKGNKGFSMSRNSGVTY